MHQQKPTKQLPPTIPKDPIDDHKTCIVKHYHSLLFLLSLQRNQHLAPATVDFFILPSAIVNLQTICKTFTLTHRSIGNFNFTTRPRRF